MHNSYKLLQFPLMRWKYPPTLIQSAFYSKLKEVVNVINCAHAPLDRCNIPASPILFWSSLNWMYRDKPLPNWAYEFLWGIWILYLRCCCQLNKIILTEGEYSEAVPLHLWYVEHALIFDVIRMEPNISYHYLPNYWAIRLWAYVFDFIIRDCHVPFVNYCLQMSMLYGLTLSMESILYLRSIFNWILDK
jgi:hypothetical protein